MGTALIMSDMVTVCSVFSCLNITVFRFPCLSNYSTVSFQSFLPMMVDVCSAAGSEQHMLVVCRFTMKHMKSVCFGKDLSGCERIRLLTTFLKKPTV